MKNYIRIMFCVGCIFILGTIALTENITPTNDLLKNSSESQVTVPYYICGDVNFDDVVNILDVVFLINFLYKGGQPPYIMESADVNSDEVVNILDVIYLINFLYKEGPEPFCPDYM